MKTETIQTLRARAKRLGLTGYSKLRKDELSQLLAKKSRGDVAHTASRAPSGPARQPGTPKPSAPTASQARTAPPESDQSPPHSSTLLSNPDMEQQVESLKFAFSRQAEREPVYGSDLGEDIERLPSIREPRLCLLPQKPGVLHGYWVLPGDALARHSALRLRLAHDSGDRLAILAEHALPSTYGHWYFHVNEGMEFGSIYLQLGEYRPDGEFVSLLVQGLARIPSLYASSRRDRRWWISDEEFRTMYRRAGGRELGRKLGWTGTGSSPGRAWPGGSR